MRAGAGAAQDRPYVGLEHLGPGTLRRCGDGVVEGVTHLAEPGDVLFGTLRPAFRKLLLVEEPLRVSPEALVLRPRTGVDPRFLLYLLAVPERVTASAAAAEGTRMPRVPAAWVLAQKVLVPPLAEQQAIGAALGDFADRASVHLRQASLLAELATATAPGGALHPLSAAVTSVIHHVHPTEVPGDTPYIGLEHLPRRHIVVTGWGQASQVASAKLRFWRGDVLFGRLRPNLHKVAVAPFDGVCSSDILVLRARPPHGPLWAWHHLASESGIADATQHATGTRMPRVSWDIVGRRLVPTPEVSVAAAFAEQTEPWCEAILRTAVAITTLDRLRDQLMPLLISGERRLS